MKPFLLVLSSPSGGGKTTIARALVSSRADVGYSVSATTRAIRPGETDGQDYHFLSREDFQSRIEGGAFVEWAEYGDHLYGTLWSEIEGVFDAGRIAVLDIDVQGAQQIRAAMPDAVLVFVLPPSAAVLAQRLLGRNTEPEHRIRQRLDAAAVEVIAAPGYDYVVENDELPDAVALIGCIIEAECHRASRQGNLTVEMERFRAEVLSEAQRIG